MAPFSPDTVDAVFHDRTEAGRALADALREHRQWTDPLVLALPRGGVPIGAEVARALHASLDVMVVRKIGHPRHPEFAVGAIASGGVSVMNPDAHDALGRVSATELERVVQRERAELQRREKLFRGDRPPLDVQGREVIVVDDGLATGATMQAAVLALRQLRPARITVGVPVGAPESCAALARIADDMVCLRTPSPFQAVGLWYRDFDQTSDDEVGAILGARPWKSPREPS